MDRTFWKPILENLEFSEETHDKLTTYIENHFYNEQSKVMSTLQFNLFGSTLPLALRVLKKIDNLDKIEVTPFPVFRDESKEGCTVGTWKQESFESDIDVRFHEDKLGDLIVEKVVDYLNKILKENDIYLYTLIIDIDVKDNKYSIYHRFRNKNFI